MLGPSLSNVKFLTTNFCSMNFKKHQHFFKLYRLSVGQVGCYYAQKIPLRIYRQSVILYNY